MKTTTVSEDIDQLFADAEKTSLASSTLAEARRMWTSLRDGAEYDTDTLVHIATLLACDFHRILALALKYKYECARAQPLVSSDTKTHSVEEPVTDRQVAKKHLTQDSDTLFQILGKYGHLPNHFANNPASLADTVRELILINGHVVANNSPELHAFAERHQRSLAIRQQSTRDLQEVFHTKKGQWLDVQDQFGEQLLFLESRRLANENITQRWLGIFGDTYLVLHEQQARFDSVRQRIEIKLANPELTIEGLDRRLREAELSRNTTLRTLRSRLALASLGIIYRAGEVISPEELSNYRRQCKALLRHIWLLLHPDTLCHHPQYGQLTEKQKIRLNELWHRAMAIKGYELGMEPGCLGTDHRSLVALEDILSTVKSILAESGLDTDVHLIVTGDTVEDQIAWLDRSIQRLEDALDGVHAELITLLNDPDIPCRAKDLEMSPSEQENKKEEMLASARSYRDEAEQLEAQLKQLFATQNHEC